MTNRRNPTHAAEYYARRAVAKAGHGTQAAIDKALREETDAWLSEINEGRAKLHLRPYSSNRRSGDYQFLLNQIRRQRV